MQSRQTVLQQHFIENDGTLPSTQLAKHQKMALSPFVFYRGSAALFYRDIADKLLCFPDELLTLPDVYVMGDCHTSNFGFFSEQGSHADVIVFAPNDFDDACVGHAIWDLCRYCSALYLAHLHCQPLQTVTHKPLVPFDQVERAATHFLHKYIAACEQIQHQPEQVNQVLKDFSATQKLAKVYYKAKRRTANGDQFQVKSALAKATIFSAGKIRFRNDPEKFISLSNKDFSELELAFSPYMDDKVIDIVERINAGTGSVNLKRYYFLIGPDEQADAKRLMSYHIVEVKQQQLAAPLRASLYEHPVNRLNPAHLTARCQRFMQRRPDLLLDEVEWKGTHWLVRSRHHAKVSLDPEDIAMGRRNSEHDGLVYYAEQCAKSLALAHCRSDRRKGVFERAVVNSMPAQVEAIVAIAKAYAKQVECDYHWFCDALNTSDSVS